MKLSIRSLNIIFSISLLLLASAFTYSYLNIRGLRSANQWVNHTNEVISNLKSIFSDVKNAESGVRGYALTKDVSHIADQNELRKKIKSQAVFLHSLISDNPEQKLYSDTLQILLTNRIAQYNSLINLTNNNVDEDEVVSLMKEGNNTTIHISCIIEKMIGFEKVLLENRNKKAAALDKNTPITIVFSGVFGFLVLLTSYIFILRDIKERNKIGKELKNKNTLLEYAQQITQMGTFEYNITTNKLSWSNEMYNIFELDKGEIPRIDFIDSLIKEDSKQIHSTRKENFAPGESYSDELRICTLSGIDKFLISNGYITTEGNALIVHGSIIDITAMKKAELTAIEQQELMRVAKEKAESASQFKTRFLSNMSHEIRTPINAILGFTTILNKQELTIQQKELLKNITISGELLLKLIGNILDISKIEEGKVVIESKSFHLKEMIRSVLSPYQHAASEKGLTFHLLIEESIPDYLLGDFPRISQVLVNLIGNALKFTTEGSITVSILLNKKQSDISFVEFSVSDTGIGIQENKQEEIFESFTQEDESISVKYGGTGLGLSIVHEVVHLMGGQINVQSPVSFTPYGKACGSKFSFILSFKLGEKGNHIHAKNILIEPFPRVLNVLVADDNEMNRKLASYTLQSLGCTYDVVDDGLQAINKVAAEKYDVILMDMQMPVCDGLKATRQIRLTENETPIIGLTANVFQEDINQCLASGMNDHLGKPYTDEDLYQIIYKWVFDIEKDIAAPRPTLANYSFIEKLSQNNSLIFREMLEMFLKQNSQLLNEIQLAMSNNDLATLSFHLHQYKSCVRMLKIEKQDELISQLELKIETHVSNELIKLDVEKMISIGEYITKEINQKLSSI